MARLQPAVAAPGVATSGIAVRLADRRLARFAAIAIALASGLLSAVVAPRGPTTTSNALLVMGLGLLAGVAGGAIIRSRWVLVALVVAYIAGMELGRLDVVGPTLDIRLDNAYGILALVLTRGIHGFLVFLPMSLGVPLGMAFARRIGWVPAGRRRAPVGTGLLGVVVVGLAALVACPPRRRRSWATTDNPFREASASSRRCDSAEPTRR